jgi:TatD DNase family protein
MRLVDAHNHLQDCRFGDDLPHVLCEMRNEGIRHAVVNGTRQSDWSSVVSLCVDYQNFLTPALGLHPWYVSSRSSSWMEELRHDLARADHSTIGECGLDLWREQSDLHDQTQVLHMHLQLARELDKPLTLHCLKAWQPLMDLLKSTAPLPPCLLHSFSGPQAMIPALVKLGAYFSLSGYFLTERKAKALGVFAQIPMDRLLVESDAPDMAPPREYRGSYYREQYHHPADLVSCVNALAALKEIPADECAEICWQNTQQWLRRKLD